MELTADSTAADLVENVRATLAVATTGGKALFAQVIVCESLAAFEAVANGYKGLVAGVIAGQPQRALGMDNAEDHQTRLPIDIAVRLLSPRAPGLGNDAAAKEMARVAEYVRQALNVDRTRGGKAMKIMWLGGYLPGTETKGDAKLVSTKPGMAFFTASIPIACAWSVS